MAVEAAALGTWSYDLRAERGWHSARAGALFGRAAREGVLTREQWRGCVHPDDWARVRDAFQQAGASGGRYDVEYRIVRPDGAVRWIAALGHVQPDADGRPMRVVGTVQDVTARHVAAAERERLLATAEEASRAKSRFLATMGHELRTPLTSIGGYAELLELGTRGPVTPAQAEDLRRIQAGQRHLLGLINAVLQYARLDVGNVHYAMDDVRLADVVREAEALVGPQFEAKRLRLDCRVEPDDLAVRADRGKLRQVLVNLLTNAAKYTNARDGLLGRVCVRGAIVEGSAPPMAQVAVIDTGIGIAADQLETIFQPFVQLHAGHARQQDGVGLGLAISRDLARGMGGELTVASTLGEGSTFTVTVPRAFDTTLPPA